MTIIQLTECPRVRDGGLKHPRKNCRDRKEGICICWPSLLVECENYIEDHPNETPFSVRFRCVLDEGM